MNVRNSVHSETDGDSTNDAEGVDKKDLFSDYCILVGVYGAFRYSCCASLASSCGIHYFFRLFFVMVSH